MEQKNIDKQTRYKKTKEVLGEGTYKTVTKAIDEEEGKEVAFNELRIKNYETETKTESSFSKEITLLRTLDHSNIIKILDYWFIDDSFIFITEFMTGNNLNDYIQKNGPLSTKLIRKWGKQILEGLVYLHTNDPPIIHRDIKNDNIFVNAAVGDVKIGDLGLAKELRNKRYTIVGTPNFMAREMFEGEGYNEKIDIYAFGMCLIEMATGIVPYSEWKDTKDIYNSVLQGILPKALKDLANPCLKSLIISCLVPNSYRFTSAQCLDHHFFHTDVVCNGSCVPDECVAVYPLLYKEIKNMELSIVSIFHNIIAFQILLIETTKFIKFEYDLNVDTVEKISGELISEKIIDQEDIEDFTNLLTMGLNTVESKMKIGKVHGGIIELNSLETANMQEKNVVISNKICKLLIDSSPNSSNETVLKLGTATLEEMALIEERMKIKQAKQDLEKKSEEETSFRLKAKLLQKDASYEPTIIHTNESIDTPSTNTEYLNVSCSIKKKGEEEGNLVTQESDNTTSSSSANASNTKPAQNQHDQNKSVSIMSSDEEKSQKLSDTENCSNDTNSVYSNTAGTNIYSSESLSSRKTNVEASIPTIKTELSAEVVSASENIQIITNEKEKAKNKIKHAQMNEDRFLEASDPSSAIYDEKSSCDTVFGKIEDNMNVIPEEDIYSFYPQGPEYLETSPIELPYCSTSTIPQHLEQALCRIEALHLAKRNKENEKNKPSHPSPTLSEKATEEKSVNDLYLNENYEKMKIKYKVNQPISKFVNDCATITGRTEDTAKSWIKALKEDHVEMVFDLKLMVYEDWDKLSLTVFASRAMQNMIYGIDSTPLKEKQLPSNPKIKEYDNKVEIKEFLTDVCSIINRTDLVSSWEDRLLAEDIQTVGELKSLHSDDWTRLGLSVFGYRILKNTILRKGKIIIDES